MNHSAESPRRLRCTQSVSQGACMSGIVHIVYGPLQACRLTTNLEATLEQHCLVQRRCMCLRPLSFIYATRLILTRTPQVYHVLSLTDTTRTMTRLRLHGCSSQALLRCS